MGATTTRLAEIWMELKDRTLLKELMAQQNVSARTLAEVAGWKSHSFMNRLLNGEATSLNPIPAARIAHHLGVPFSLLFRSRMSGDSGQSGAAKQLRPTG